MTRIILLIINLAIFSAQMNAQEKQSIEEIKPKMLENAIEIGKNFNIVFDYSDKSIDDVEEILSEIHEEYQKSNNEEGFRGIALIFSFYIVAVIEKHHGKGKFERNHKSIGEDTFPFYWNDTTIFPYGWCLKGIFDGDGDNIAIKYKMLVLNKK